MASIRDVVGVVTQDPHLFHDTLRANLLYARPEATEADLLDAMAQAQVGHLVGELPDGLDTVIGERGYRLSGGEKQRVALARLMLKAPDIVVLDEATAHLDSESEAAVQRALRETLTGRTSLVIAHRLSTVREADELLVIDDGRIVERGTHASLLAENGLYAELYRTQFADQEESRPSRSRCPACLIGCSRWLPGRICRAGRSKVESVLVAPGAPGSTDSYEEVIPCTTNSANAWVSSSRSSPSPTAVTSPPP